jgi:hypothetical protein
MVVVGGGMRIAYDEFADVVDVGQLVVDDVEEHDELRPHHAHLPIAHDQVDAVGPLIRTTHAPSNIRRLHHHQPPHENKKYEELRRRRPSPPTRQRAQPRARRDEQWERRACCRTSMAV